MDSRGCSKVDAKIVETYWQMVDRLVKAGLSRPDAELASFTFLNILRDEEGEGVTLGESVGLSSGPGDVARIPGEIGAIYRLLDSEIRASYRMLDAGNLIEGNAAHTRHLELRGEILSFREDAVTLRTEMFRFWGCMTAALVTMGIAVGFIAASII